VKGRVIYRGYAPKNSYFYLKTIKCKQLIILEIEISSSTRKVAHDYDLKFNSKFESGNLSAVTKVSKK
jgi:hypothetical protein